MVRACIVLGGGPDTPSIEGYDLVICADSGYERLPEGTIPTHIVGDMDSIDRGGLSRARADGVSIRSYPADKDLSDGEAALLLAVELGADEITLEGTLGDRSDHLLSTFLLLRSVPPSIDARLHLGQDVISLVSPGHPVNLEDPPSIISILPATDSVRVWTKGLRFKLDGDLLRAGTTRGVHNEPLERKTEVYVSEGSAYLILSYSRG